MLNFVFFKVENLSQAAIGLPQLVFPLNVTNHDTREYEISILQVPKRLTMVLFSLPTIKKKLTKTRKRELQY